MLDPTQLPILLKAVDFIFDEGRKILEERRQRRKIEDQAAGNENAKPETEPAAQAPTVLPESKQDLLTAKVDELRWKNHEAEISHLVRLLDTYSSNHRLAKEQYAKWGTALVPPIIVNNMVEAENAVIETTARLEVLLSKVYAKENPATN